MAESHLCQNCKHRQLKQRSLGNKSTNSTLTLIKQLRQPRNIETPFINLVDFLKSHRKNNSSHVLDDIPKFNSRLPTSTTKQKTEMQVEDATTTTSRFEQIPITQPLYRGSSAGKIKSSAFYKMKQMRLTSRDSQRKQKILDIGPIFNQVSKYVRPARPATGKNSEMRFLFEEIERIHTTTSARQSMLKRCKSDITLKLPVSSKLSEVQSLLKRE